MISQLTSGLTQALKHRLLARGIWLGRTTDINSILAFLGLVKPMRTNHELIRIGSDTDGGYLVPDDMEDVGICFSPGVCETAHFENELTRRGIKCFLADYSVEKPPIENDFFDFEKKYLGCRNNDIIHPNNASRPVSCGDIVIPPSMEFTFLSKDRIAERKGGIMSFPHRLDRANVRDNDDFPLPRCWY